MCNFTSHFMWEVVVGVYKCATSHFQLMGSSGGVYKCATSHLISCGKWWLGYTSVQLHIFNSWVVVVGVYKCATSHLISCG